MSPSQLANYLRAHRKRLGLSQEEVAFMLGVEDGSKVCRHERFVRMPSLETALAFEAIFHRPVRELFAGLYEQIAQNVVVRAKILIRRTARRPATRLNKRKQQTLSTIVEPPGPNSKSS